MSTARIPDGTPLRVLVACEFSGIVRDAFIARGHDAVSCDLLASERPGPHIQADVLTVLDQGWDLMVAFPPCTDLSVIGASHWAQKQADGRQQQAIELVRTLLLAPIRHIAIENPVGRLSTALREPDQIIEPWQFGDPWYKRTCLWLLRLPLLRFSQVVKPNGHWVDGGTRFTNPDRTFGDAACVGFRPEDRAARSLLRSRTFPGIAEAMADQWLCPQMVYQDTLWEAS